MPNLNILSAQAHPALPELRLVLRQAMTNLGQLPTWTETYTDDETTPPTLYTDGRPIVQWHNKEHVITAEQVKTLLIHSERPVWHQRLSRGGQMSVRFLSALLIAFFPKCPFCWAAYMSYVGATGIVSVTYQPWLIWVLVGLLIVNVAVLYQTRNRHGLGPFFLCLTGAAVLITNRLYVHESELIWLGAVGLLIGSLWNSLSPKMTDSLQYFARKLVRSTVSPS